MSDRSGQQKARYNPAAIVSIFLSKAGISMPQRRITTGVPRVWLRTGLPPKAPLPASDFAFLQESQIFFDRKFAPISH
ncbi:MAG: hypothetical protein ACI9HK_004761 [Pirellulaceae bacterium]|jgi:hypothetical protein